MDKLYHRLFPRREEEEAVGARLRSEFIGWVVYSRALLYGCIAYGRPRVRTEILQGNSKAAFIKCYNREMQERRWEEMRLAEEPSSPDTLIIP